MNKILIDQLKAEIEKGKALIENTQLRNSQYENFLSLAIHDVIPDHASVQNSTVPDIMDIINSKKDYVNYPTEEDLLIKFQYLEEMQMRFWSSKEMFELISKIEGPHKAKAMFKDVTQRLSRYVKSGKLISMKYNNSNRYTFYSTRTDWVGNIRKEKGKIVADLLPGREPNYDLLKNLSDEQKSTDRIVWSGLQLA